MIRLNEKLIKKERFNCNKFSDFYSLWEGIVANKNKICRGEIGDAHSTNLKNLLGNPNMGNYTNCIFELLTELDSEGVIRITAYAPWVGGIKVAYLTIVNYQDVKYTGWLNVY